MPLREDLAAVLDDVGSAVLALLSHDAVEKEGAPDAKGLEVTEDHVSFAGDLHDRAPQLGVERVARHPRRRTWVESPLRDPSLQVELFSLFTSGEVEHETLSNEAAGEGAAEVEVRLR